MKRNRDMPGEDDIQAPQQVISWIARHSHGFDKQAMFFSNIQVQ